MKKAIVLIQLILMLTIGIFGCFSVVYANMAAPQPNRLGTGIVFEKYDNISVISENLDISIKEDGNAEIMAEYKMKNLTNEKLSVRTMFIAPYSKKYSSYIVSVNNKEIETIESVYTIEDTTKITSENVWQDVIENGKKIQEDGSGEYDYYCKNNVVTIEYILEFEGNETIDVGVYYSQPLAGRPVVSSFYNYEAYGEIEYFLTPAKYWNGFEDLTITISMQGPLKNSRKYYSF